MRCCEQLRARSDHGKQAAPSKYSKDDATYRKQIGWFRAAMEAMFPAPPRTLDNRKDAAAAERAGFTAKTGRGTAGFGEDVSLSFISLRRMEGLIVLHDKGSLIMVSIRQIRSNTSVSLALS